MDARRKKLVWRALPFAACVVVTVWLWSAYRSIHETEAELKARLSEADVAALIAWGRETALSPQASTTSWSREDLPDELTRIGVKWAATSEFHGEKSVFFYLHSANGKSGLLVKEPAARWPDPPNDWSQWRPGLWYHRE